MTSSNLWGTNQTQFFFELNPDLVLDTVEALGFKTTGRVLTMNSMENRVIILELLNSIALEDGAKFKSRKSMIF